VFYSHSLVVRRAESISKKMTVQKSIETAFASIPYPGHDKIADHQNCPECDELRQHFCGATWRGHTIAELQQYQSALPLFTPEALQYFLPAYMLVSYGAWSEADMIPFSILQICLPPPPDTDVALQKHNEERYAIFTRPQREAIAMYLLEWSRSDSLVLGAEDIPRAIERLLRQ